MRRFVADPDLRVRFVVAERAELDVVRMLANDVDPTVADMAKSRLTDL